MIPTTPKARNACESRLAEDVAFAHSILADDSDGDYTLSDANYAGVLSEACEELLAIVTRTITDHTDSTTSKGVSAIFTANAGLRGDNKSLHEKSTHSRPRTRPSVPSWRKQPPRGNRDG